MLVRAMCTNDGQQVDLTGLTVLVGPNNSGKSQTLRDIGTLVSTPQASNTVISRLIEDPQFDIHGYLQNVQNRPDPSNPLNQRFSGLDSNLGGSAQINGEESSIMAQFESNNVAWVRQQFGRFNVAFLDAGSRLTVAQTCDSYDAHHDHPSTLLQHLYLNEAVHQSLQRIFKDTFGLEICLDYSGLQKLCLRVSPSFGIIPKDPREAHPVMSKFGRLDDQGDGFRSFVGVVLSVLLTRNRLILLDEPEAFLHPEQARRLGRWLADEVVRNGGQVVVATHNSHFLQGLLTSGEDARLVRLNREGDSTRFATLNSETTARLSKSPLLSSQRVIESIFHRRTVICEADSDRTVYQAVALQQFDQTDTLFVNAHNKQTCAVVAEELKNSDIDSAVIVDIDILHSRSELQKLMQAKAVSQSVQSRVLGCRDLVAAEVDSQPEIELLNKITASTKELLAQLSAKKHTLSGSRSALKRIHDDASKWSTLKKNGLAVLGDAVRTELEACVNLLSKAGVHIVYVGELESWMQLNVNKKSWTPLALEQIHQGNCPANLHRFIEIAIGLTSKDQIEQPELGSAETSQQV